MKLMRNLRTGKVAGYDAELVEGGRWEIIPEPTPQDKPFDQDFINAKDAVHITLTSSSGETTEQTQA
jgi:hypothetical protein